MHQEQRQRTVDGLKAKGIERALFASFDSVKWLTGFAPSVELGFSLFMGGPFLVWLDDGHFTLIVLDLYAAEAAAFAAEPDGAVLTYPGYTLETPITATENLAAVLRERLAQSAGRGTVGIEQNALTAALQAAVSAALPQAAFVPVDGWLAPLRMVKTDEELAKLRRSFALADIGQAAARAAVAVGQREIDVWMAAQTAINAAAGCRVPLGNDCVAGQRQQNIGGWPLDYPLLPDGALIVDISAIHNGYWSDGCATLFPAEPTPEQKRVYAYVLDALDYAVSLARPGIQAREIDRLVRAFIEKGGYPVYPHHTGHGIGVSGHEAPRIVPYNEETLAPGMVILLEPGVYFPGHFGVRLEDALLITADGVEILTHHLPR